MYKRQSARDNGFRVNHLRPKDERRENMATYQITATFDGDTTTEAQVQAFDAESAAFIGATRWIIGAIENGMDAPRKTEFIRQKCGCIVRCTHDPVGMIDETVITATA